jgi:hypothetical protein
LNRDDVERVGTMTKKEWDENEAKWAVESVNEMNVNKKFGSKYDIGAGSMGNGTTFWNRAQEVRGDYKTIAHVSDEGKVTFYDKKLPNDVKKHIEDYAKTKTEVREGKINEDVKFKDGDYEFISKSGYSIVTYKGNTIADGNFDRDSDSYWFDHSSFKGQKSFDDGKEALKYFKSNRIISESNTVNEVRYRLKIKTKNGESFTTRVYNSKKEADDAHWKYAKDNRFKSIELVTETLDENESTIKTLKESHPFSLKKYISESTDKIKLPSNVYDEFEGMVWNDIYTDITKYLRKLGYKVMDPKSAKRIDFASGTMKDLLDISKFLSSYGIKNTISKESGGQSSWYTIRINPNSIFDKNYPVK